MEYVDGLTLREIHHSGEPLVVLVGYLVQVGEGLAKVPLDRLFSQIRRAGSA